MDRHEGMRGGCALFVALALIATGGCGNSASELFDPLSATMTASGAGRNTLPERVAGAAGRPVGERAAL